jgi:glutathione S-transferase
MSLTLYYGPGACSFVPHAMLEASGAEFEPLMVKLHKGEQREQAFQTLNPRGQVPVLVDANQAISQIMAICLYLDEKFPKCEFLPAKGIARAHALQNLAWMNNTVHPTFTHVFRPAYFSDDESAHEGIRAVAIRNFRARLADIQNMVQQMQQEGQQWLSGAKFGPLDAYALTFVRWGTMAGITPQEHPLLWEHVQHIAQLPAVARTLERERIELVAKAL